MDGQRAKVRAAALSLLSLIELREQAEAMHPAKAIEAIRSVVDSMELFENRNARVQPELITIIWPQDL